jgi:hypothetical protein
MVLLITECVWFWGINVDDLQVIKNDYMIDSLCVLIPWYIEAIGYGSLG